MPIVISKVMQIKRREKEEMDMINVGRYFKTYMLAEQEKTLR